MPRQVVDVSARSRLFREQPLLSHAWVVSPAEILEFLCHPRSELKKMGIRLPSECQIETVLQNHDWLAGRSHGLTDDERICVFARGEGDGRRFYRVTLYASKNRGAAEKQLLHRPDEEQRRARPISDAARLQADATRRSLLTDPLQLSVQSWLMPLSLDLPGTKSADEAHRIFVSTIDVVRRVVAEDADVRAAMDDVGSHLQQSFNPDYTGVFRTLAPRELPFQRAFAGLMYARALGWIRASALQAERMLGNVNGHAEDPGPVVRQLAEAVETLDLNFPAHATVAATFLRQQDEALDARLSEAERLFDSFDPGPEPRASAFEDHARGLERFDPANSNQWWYLPGLVAVAFATFETHRYTQYPGGPG
ncbi:MAG TPA: hypothetical protein VNT03_13440 [Baekduia sp.]|nr:hypothetical protein [Baekduia sp.]